MQNKNELLLNKTEKNCLENYMISVWKAAKYYKKNKGVITKKTKKVQKNVKKRYKSKDWISKKKKKIQVK